MPILLQYIFAIGTFQGLLLSGLLIFGARVSDASRILGIWCLCHAIWFLARFITMDGEINIFSSLIGWNYFLPAAYGALLYLYCRLAILGRSLIVTDLWHLAPIFACYLLNLDILLTSPEVKLNLVLSKPPNSSRFLIAESIMFLQAFIYLGFSMALIYKCQRQAKNTLSSFNPNIFGWLWKLLILNSLIWLLKTIMSLAGDLAILSHIGDGLIVILIYSIAMAQWRDPKLFQIEQLTAKPQESVTTSLAGLLEPNLGSSDDSQTKDSGVLNSSIRTSLLKVVRLHMQEQQTYRDDQLTLTSLAEAVGVSTHHLSEILNQQEGKNFYRFVNEYRIDYICEQLKQDPSTKILELAMSAGFSSKSTFNAVFKQLTKLTPSQYRNQLDSSLLNN